SLPRDAAEHPAPSLLCRCIQPRSASGRSAAQDSRSPRNGTTRCLVGGVRGLDSRPLSGLHLLGAVLGQSATAGREPRTNGIPRCPAGRAGVARRLVGLWSLRPSDGSSVHRLAATAQLRLQSSSSRLWRTVLPEPGREGTRRVDRASTVACLGTGDVGVESPRGRGEPAGAGPSPSALAAAAGTSGL